MQPTPMPISDPAVRGAFASLTAGVDTLAGRPLPLLGDNDLLAAARELVAVTARVDAARLALYAEIDTRGAALTVGASSTLAWIKAATRARHGDAVRDLALGHALRDQRTQTATALAAGEVHLAHAEQIRATLAALPDHLDPAIIDQAETRLLGDAALFDPGALHRLGQHLHDVLNPDGPADIEHDENDGHDKRELWIRQADNGQVSLRAKLDAETGALLIAAIHPLAQPRHTGADDHETRPGNVAGAGCAERDLRTKPQRQADALGDLLRLATSNKGMPTAGGATPTLVVTVPYAQLRDQIGAGTLDTGALITPQTVRRLACDAQILAAALGARSEVIDIARQTRVVPTATRRALVLRDQHCRRPGCNRPPTQCHAHHLRHWADGGPTDLGNLVLLCDYHHREIHNDRWTLTPIPGAPPQFHPPHWARQP